MKLVNAFSLLVAAVASAINNLAGGTAAWSTGISASNKSNITIRNGRLSWFRTGIALTSYNGGLSRGHTIESVDIQYPQLTGILVDGRGITVRGCSVRRVGGTDNYAVGIDVNGDGNVIEDNVISDFTVDNGRGISAFGSRHLIVDNRITNPNNYGLFLLNSTTTKYRDNLVTGALEPYVGGVDAGNNQ